MGDDTDLLVLLIYHADMTSHEIYFKPEPKSNSTKIRLWNIQKPKENLGPVVCKKILFVHAVLGCDTTSRVFGIGKAVALTKIRQNSSFLSLAKVFHMQHTPHDAIIEAGEKVLICLYNAQRTTSLDKLCYHDFKRRLPGVKNMLRQTVYLRLLQLQNITVSGCTIKCSNGWEELT